MAVGESRDPMDIPRSSFSASWMDGKDCLDRCVANPSFSSGYVCRGSEDGMWERGGAGAVIDSLPPTVELTAEEG